MRHLESRLGMALYDRWCRQYPKHRDAMIHIPNGAHLAGNAYKRARQMQRLKAEGLQTGATDYFIAIPRANYCGMWLEIKAGKGKPTEGQIKFMENKRLAGYRAEWGADFDECWNIIEKYMGL